MSRVKCKRENWMRDMVDKVRAIFRKAKEKDQMLERINDRLRRKYGFDKRVL